MRIERLTPIIWTTELEATVAFYQQTLGFVVDELRPEWNWAHLHRDEVQLMIAARSADEYFDGLPKFTGSFYFTVSDVDAWWEKLKDKVEVFYPIENFAHHMREFGIRDNNGYILQFGRELLPGEQVTAED